MLLCWIKCCVYCEDCIEFFVVDCVGGYCDDVIWDCFEVIEWKGIDFDCNVLVDMYEVGIMVVDYVFGDEWCIGWYDFYDWFYCFDYVVDGVQVQLCYDVIDRCVQNLKV